MKRYTRRTLAQWKSLVSEQQAGELSAPQFCKQNDIAYAGFSKWKNRVLASETKSLDALPAFIELECDVESNAQRIWAVELELGSGMVLRIAQS